MEAGVAMGLISMLSVLAVYFWVVRRSSGQDAAQKE
jgi:hypothetical protein